MEKDVAKKLTDMMRYAAEKKGENTVVKLDGFACDTLIKYIDQLEETAEMYDSLCK